MQLIFRASNILEAHIVAGLLDAHGLATHVGGHYLQGAVGDLPASEFAHVLSMMKMSKQQKSSSPIMKMVSFLTPKRNYSAK